MVKKLAPRKTPLLSKPEGQRFVPEPAVLEPAPNFDLLSEETKEELRKQARAKVEADEIDRASEAFKAAEIERLEREAHPEAFEEEREITIDVALYADRVILDGRTYMFGRTYTVKKRVYDSLMDIMARTHRHYADTHRDPMRAMQEAAQQIAKGGDPGRATLNASTGGVQKF